MAWGEVTKKSSRVGKGWGEFSKGDEVPGELSIANPPDEKGQQKKEAEKQAPITRETNPA